MTSAPDENVKTPRAVAAARNVPVESIGRPQRFLVSDLPRGLLARLLIRD